MPWYDNFFHGLVQDAWQAAQTEDQTQFEVDFLHDLLELQPGHRVLDVFCGYGRHALELARLGCSVTGVDISAESVHQFNSRAGAENLSAQAVNTDFLTVALPGGFDAAYCMGNSFSFLPYDDMLAFLQKIAGQIKPGGRFVADTGMIAESILPDFQERSWMQVGDITLLLDNEYIAAESCIESHLTYIGSAGTERRTARHYLYTMAELRRMLQLAGLPVTEAFSDLEGSEFRLGDDRLLLLSQKI